MSAQDIEVTLKEDWDMIFTCRDADGALINVSSVEWRLANSANLIMKATVGNGISIINTGVVWVQITPTLQTSANVSPGMAQHELFVLDTNNISSIQMTGRVNIKNSLKRQYP